MFIYMVSYCFQSWFWVRPESGDMRSVSDFILNYWIWIQTRFKMDWISYSAQDLITYSARGCWSIFIPSLWICRYSVIKGEANSSITFSKLSRKSRNIWFTCQPLLYSLYRGHPSHKKLSLGTKPNTCTLYRDPSCQNEMYRACRTVGTYLYTWTRNKMQQIIMEIMTCRYCEGDDVFWSQSRNWHESWGLSPSQKRPTQREGDMLENWSGQNFGFWVDIRRWVQKM
jgi:hypothetical protein